MSWKIIGQIRNIETIAEGRGIRELSRLLKRYGGKNWRKCKGVARVLLNTGEVYDAELHWYEAHGVGKVDMKLKRWL
jgi:hypothetical protein